MLDPTSYIMPAVTYFCLRPLPGKCLGTMLRTTTALSFHRQEDPIRGFEVGEYLSFMKELERSYRHIVLTDMKTISKSVH